MAIYPIYKMVKTEELYNNNAIEGNNDYPTLKELKNTINNLFEHYPCPDCGGHRTDGTIIVEIGEVNFFKEVWKKGFFGKKLVTEKTKTVWRIHSVYLKPSGFLSSAGRIWCKSCGWEERGVKGIRWVSFNDVRNGNF